MPDTRDDRLTVAAIAVLAMCLATFAHEAVGHGSVCLLLGGRITQLTSVYFDCSRHDVWLPAGGPLGNLGAALLSGIGLRFVTAARSRLLLMLVLAFSVYWIGGYLLYSAVTGEGDNAIVARILFGAPDGPWRIGLFLLGLAFYWIGRPLVRGRTSILRLSWFAASLAAVLAAAFYAPDRRAAMVQAALEIGAAAVPLVLPARHDGETAKIPRSFGWIAASAVVLLSFIATLGRGLP